MAGRHAKPAAPQGHTLSRPRTPLLAAELLHGETAAELAWGVIFGILLPTALLALSAFLVVKHLTLVVSKRGCKCHVGEPVLCAAATRPAYCPPVVQFKLASAAVPLR